MPRTGESLLIYALAMSPACLTARSDALRNCLLACTPHDHLPTCSRCHWALPGTHLSHSWSLCLPLPQPPDPLNSTCHCLLPAGRVEHCEEDGPLRWHRVHAGCGPRRPGESNGRYGEAECCGVGRRASKLDLCRACMHGQSGQSTWRHKRQANWAA